MNEMRAKKRVLLQILEGWRFFLPFSMYIQKSLIYLDDESVLFTDFWSSTVKVENIYIYRSRWIQKNVKSTFFNRILCINKKYLN